MKRVAAEPVDELDVRVSKTLAVEIVRLARIEQHVAQPRDRNERLHRVLPLLQERARKRRGMSAFGVDRPVAETEAAAGQADLSEYARERDRHPECLLAVIIVRLAAMRRARPLIAAGSTPHIRAAHPADLGTPSVSPMR